MKTADLVGRMLDYYVGKAEGEDPMLMGSVVVARNKTDGGNQWTQGPLLLAYSTNWTQCGPLIAKYKVCLDAGDGSFTGNKTWEAHLAENAPVHANEEVTGSTPLQAICRAVVRAAFGDEVDEVLL